MAPTDPTPVAPEERAAFSGTEYIAWLCHARKRGVRFVVLAGDADPARGQCLLKHDVHGPPSMALPMARAEAAAGVSAVYFLMTEPSPIACDWDEHSYWEAVREIASLGHEVGLHLCLSLAVASPDVIGSIASLSARFRDEVGTCRFANSHGDTSQPAVTVNLQDVFADTLAGDDRRSVLLRAIESCTLRDLRRVAGIEYWVDAALFSERGKTPSMYITDNPGSMVIPARGLASERFAFDRAWVQASVDSMLEHFSLALVHPQWVDFGVGRPDARERLARTDSSLVGRVRRAVRSWCACGG